MYLVTRASNLPQLYTCPLIFHHSSLNPPIVILPVRRVRNRVVPKTSKVVVRRGIRASLALHEAVHRAQAIGPALAQSSADGVQGQDAVVQAHADEFVGCVGRVVAVLSRVVLGSVGGDGGRVAAGAADYFGDETAPEGGHVGEDEGAVGVGGILG